MRLGKAFTVVAVDRETECGEVEAEETRARSEKLKLFIREYFTEIQREVPARPPAVEACQYEESVRGDIRSFVCTHRDHVWTGRAVARILHGIQSPNFPAKQQPRMSSTPSMSPPVKPPARVGSLGTPDQLLQPSRESNRSQHES